MLESGYIKLEKRPAGTCLTVTDTDYKEFFKRAVESKVTSDYWWARGNQDQAVSALNCSRKFYKKAKAGAPLFSGMDVCASYRLGMDKQ